MNIVPVLSTNVVQREYVGVIERGCDPSLARNPVACGRIVRLADGDQLESDVTSKSCVARSIYFPHATGPERTEDFVGAQPCADGDRET